MRFSTLFTPFPPIKRFVMERSFTTFLSGAVLLLAFFFIREALTPKMTDTTAEKEMPAKQVATFEIGKDASTGTVIGTLNREHVSTIVATVSGVIDTVSVKEGAFVSVGTQLVHIAPSAATSARMLAEAERSTTKKNRATEEKILDLNKKISESETTSGRKEDLAKANKKIGKENLDLKRIASELNVDIAKAGEQTFAPFAPFSGRVEALFVSPGDFVTPGTPIATVIGNTPHSLIRAEVPSSLALLIDPKGMHTVMLPDGKKVPVTLNYLSKSAVQANAFQATFAIPDASASTLGDAFTLVMTLALRTTTDSIFIPLSAVEITRDRATTLIEQDGEARQITVTPGEVLGNFIEITEGLSAGDHIILDRNIHSDDQITLKN